MLITFNARNDHDRCKFADDMRENISEMDEMESLRIEAELERQKSGRSRFVCSEISFNLLYYLELQIFLLDYGPDSNHYSTSDSGPSKKSA